MWELVCEDSWAPKNPCFWTVGLEKTLESTLDCKEIQPVHPISPEYSLEGLMLRLKLQYFGHLMRRVDSLERPWCWEGLGAGGERDDREWDGWKASLTWWTWVWVNSGSWWWTGRPGLLQFMGSQSDTTERLNWIELNTYPTQTLPENCRGRYTSKLILWGHHHPNTKTWQRRHRKRKLQANITDEHRCKNP